MSEHIISNATVSQGFDYGDFIAIKEFRVRIGQIISYHPYVGPAFESTLTYYLLRINYINGPQGFTVEFNTEEELIKEAERLDWIFKKKYLIREDSKG